MIFLDSTYIIWYHLFVEPKKVIQMNVFTKQKETHRLREQTYGYQEEERDRLGVWDWYVHTAVFKIDNQ